MTPEPFEDEIAAMDMQYQALRKRVKELTDSRKFDYVISAVRDGKQVYWCRTIDTQGKTVGHFFQQAELDHPRVHRDKTYRSSKDYLDYLVEMKCVRIQAEVQQVPRV